MRWSLKLGRWAGIDVYVHLTFVLFLGFIAVSAYLQAGTAAAVADSVAYLLALFASVVLHEYGHALAARRFGIPTRDITLYPIGGVARLERMPEKPAQELIVALAGPAVNVVIALVLGAALLITGQWTPLSELGLVSGNFVERVLLANASLVLFNLIPAFPMDGGRVLRALLALRLDYARATRIAATLGQGVAVLFGIAGLFGNPMLILVAVFVWAAAGQEADQVEMKAALSDLPVARAMLTDFRTVSPYDPLLRATDLILSGSQADFPVVEDGRVVGVLTHQDLFTALAQRGQAARVGEVMRRQFGLAGPYDALEPLLRRMQAAEWRLVPVVSQGQLVGLVTPENIRELLLVRNALRARRMFSA